MTKRFFSYRAAAFAAVLATLALGIGARAARADDMPAIHFADASRVRVDATSLSLYVENRPPNEYPHVMYRAPFSFEQAARVWADSHFALSGNSVNTLRVTLRQGDITEKLLPRTHGIKGLFTKDQSAEYEADLDLEVAIVDPNGTVIATADGKAWAKQTITEGATEADKRAVWADMIKTAFDNLDQEFQPRLRSVMAAYIH